MRRIITSGLMAALLVLGPGQVLADDGVAAQLKAMQDRMSQLEDKLEATSDELAVANKRVDEQHQLIEYAGIGGGMEHSS